MDQIKDRVDQCHYLRNAVLRGNSELSAGIGGASFLLCLHVDN
ncbi:hypothetical protein [Paenibacillus sp. FSL H7-0331]|nr:hypothetical protein [Paenibacillus sp. FSL H7-0331]